MAKKVVKLPKDLQLDDPFFIIEAAPMDDHKGIFSNSPISHISLVEEVVKGNDYHDRDESLVILKGRNKKTYTAPAFGKNGDPEIGDLISDEDVAYEAALKMAGIEKKKALQLLQEAEKVVSGVEDNIKSLETRAPGGAKATRWASKPGKFEEVLQNAFDNEEKPETAPDVND